ncbi:hypothetical protein, partial [Plasmodium yoelii yoelii]
SIFILYILYFMENMVLAPFILDYSPFGCIF